MSPKISAWLARVRAEAEVPGTIAVVVGSTLRLLPEDIVGKSDDELLAFLREKLEQG